MILDGRSSSRRWKTYCLLDGKSIKNLDGVRLRDSGALRAYARPREGETNSVADEDVYDSRKNRTDHWSLEEPACRKLNTRRICGSRDYTRARAVSSLQLPPFFKVWTLRPIYNGCPVKKPYIFLACHPR